MNLKHKRKTTTKKPSIKTKAAKVCGNGTWIIVSGELTRPQGRPNKVKSLFKVIGEKIPFEFMSKVQANILDEKLPTKGVYIAHDSMGYPRYIGRGDIFKRLDARRKAQILELCYFSFFIVEESIHEREIETIMIRAAGPLLDFNYQKVSLDIHAGDVRDFEAGTKYFERQYKKGKKLKAKKK